MSTAPLPSPATDVLVAPLTDELVLLDLASKRYFQVNATGKQIWEALAATRDRAAVVRHLVAEFAVDEAEAGRAVDAFVDELRGLALVRDA